MHNVKPARFQRGVTTETSLGVAAGLAMERSHRVSYVGLAVRIKTASAPVVAALTLAC